MALWLAGILAFVFKLERFHFRSHLNDSSDKLTEWKSRMF